MRAAIFIGFFFLVSLSLIPGDAALPLSRGFKMKAIYTTVNNRKTFLGKHINNTIIREFPFSKAVLWQTKGLGFDKRLLGYATSNKVKQFIFSDPVKRISLKIGIRAAIFNGEENNYGEGLQWYIPKSMMKKIEGYRKAPYIKKEVII